MLELTKEGLIQDLKDKAKFFTDLSVQNEETMKIYDDNYAIASYFKGKIEAYKIASESIEQFIAIIEKFY